MCSCQRKKRMERRVATPAGKARKPRPRRSDKRIKAKNATSCGNAFMTDVMSARGGLASPAESVHP